MKTSDAKAYFLNIMHNIKFSKNNIMKTSDGKAHFLNIMHNIKFTTADNFV